MRFEKWQALGNDYLIVEAAALPWELSEARIRRICDPHFGAGADGILLLAPVADPDVVAELRIFNPDGSEAELSGNGAREAVMYLRRSGWTDRDEFTIATKAGPIRPTIRSKRECTLEMGKASTTSPDFPSGGEDGRGEVEAAGRRWSFQHVSIGNPQCAIAVGDELESIDLPAIGPEIENSDLFPNRTNVSFFRREWRHGPGPHLRARRGGDALVWHRRFRGGGCGAPGRRARRACGLSGTRGKLQVEIGEGLSVRLTGWAEPVYRGS